MERGALIGGVAVVGLLAAFAAVFVMVAGSGGTGPDVSSSTRPAEKVELETTDGKVHTVDRPILTEEGPDGTRYFDEEGIERKPNPSGKGAEEWDRIRAERNQQQIDRARTVIETFATDLEAERATELRDIFEHMFTSSGELRAERADGKLSRREFSDQMGQLRTETLTDLTTLLGGEELSRLKTEMRRVDAYWL